VKRVHIICSLLAVFIIMSSLSCGKSTSTEEELVVDSWGGWFQEQQRRTMFEPFETDTGIRVVDLSDGESQLAIAKAQVEYGRGEIAIIHGDASWLFRGQREGLWAPIDYSLVDTSEVYDDVVEDFGFGILYWSFNIVYNTAAFPNDHPSSWAEVWEYAIEHPGRVALWGARPNYVIEAALMAAGYGLDTVYPLNEQKIEEAFESLDRIKDNVRWYDTGSQGQKLFYDEEVVLGMFYGGDTFGLIEKGAPLQVEWNQGIYTRDYWLVVKNAPHLENAMKFINFVSKADIQSQFAMATAYGPINRNAFNLISDVQFLSRLPSWPPNKERQLSYDFQWWGEHDEEIIERWNNWLRK